MPKGGCPASEPSACRLSTCLPSCLPGYCLPAYPSSLSSFLFPPFVFFYPLLSLSLPVLLSLHVHPAPPTHSPLPFSPLPSSPLLLTPFGSRWKGVSQLANSLGLLPELKLRSWSFNLTPAGVLVFHFFRFGVVYCICCSFWRLLFLTLYFFLCFLSCLDLLNFPSFVFIPIVLSPSPLPLPVICSFSYFPITHIFFLSFDWNFKFRTLPERCCYVDSVSHSVICFGEKSNVLIFVSC